VHTTCQQEPNVFNWLKGHGLTSGEKRTGKTLPKTTATSKLTERHTRQARQYQRIRAGQRCTMASGICGGRFSPLPSRPVTIGQIVPRPNAVSVRTIVRTSSPRVIDRPNEKRCVLDSYGDCLVSPTIMRLNRALNPNCGPVSGLTICVEMTPPVSMPKKRPLTVRMVYTPSS
jgi:hypothetical protein